MAENDLRRVTSHSRTITEDWQDEAPLLRPVLAAEFDAAAPTVVCVDAMGRVCVGTNRYSVPIRLSGIKVEVRARAATIEVLSGGKTVAIHERLHLKNAERLVLDHYLDLLWEECQGSAIQIHLGSAKRIQVKSLTEKRVLAQLA